MLIRRSSIVFVSCTALTASLTAQVDAVDRVDGQAAESSSSPLPGADGSVDEDAVAFFLEEGLERSQVMEHLSWLCDVYGPRVTGSPNLRKAQAWAAERFTQMGMRAEREEWGPFGRGWQCDHVSVAVVGDNPWPVIAYPKAWSPSIDGRIEADVVHVASLTQDELKAMDLTGKVVLMDEVRPVSEAFDSVSKRHDAESLLRLSDSQRVETRRRGRSRQRGAPAQRLPHGLPEAHADARDRHGQGAVGDR